MAAAIRSDKASLLKPLGPFRWVERGLIAPTAGASPGGAAIRGLREAIFDVLTRAMENRKHQASTNAKALRK
ncbi:MAG TPA: hypothetical protein VGH40_22480 [Roseiarcus sp.]